MDGSLACGAAEVALLVCDFCGKCDLERLDRQPGSELPAVDDDGDTLGWDDPLQVSLDLCQLRACDARDAVELGAAGAACARARPPARVEYHGIPDGDDRRLGAEGEHELLAEVEPSPFLGIGLTLGFCEEGPGVRQVGKAPWGVIADEHRRVRHALLGLEQDLDVGGTLGIEGVGD